MRNIDSGIDKIIIKSTELAVLLDITPRRVQQLTGTVFKKVNKGKHAEFNLKEAIKSYQDYRLELEKKKFKTNDMEINEARRRREVAEAQLKEIELQIKKSQLLDKNEVENLLTKIIYNSKTKLLSIPNAISRRLVKKTSIREIKVILENAIYEALDELGRLNDL